MAIKLINSVIQVGENLIKWLNQKDPDKRAGLLQNTIEHGFQILIFAATIALTVTAFSPIAWPVVVSLAAMVNLLTLSNMLWKLVDKDFKQSVKNFFGIDKLKDRVSAATEVSAMQIAEPVPTETSSVSLKRTSLSFFSPHPSAQDEKLFKPQWEKSSLSKTPEAKLVPRPKI